MLDLKGNTAIYLMYSYARICSIASKAGVKKCDLASVLPSVQEAKENALCLHLLKVQRERERERERDRQTDTHTQYIYISYMFICMYICI
jgi:arginyl-tRNA synthetase